MAAPPLAVAAPLVAVPPCETIAVWMVDWTFAVQVAGVETLEPRSANAVDGISKANSHGSQNQELPRHFHSLRCS